MSQPLPEPLAMLFWDRAGYGESLRHAQAFIAEHGRIATVDDVVDARLASTIESPAWRHQIVTSSRIYVGADRNGVMQLAFAHGLRRLPSARQYRDDGFGEASAISLREFHDLLAGRYGPVTVLPFNELCERRSARTTAAEMYGHRGNNLFTAEEALADPFMLAVLGDRAREFIARLAAETRAWLSGHVTDAALRNCTVLRDMTFLSEKSVLPKDRKIARVFPVSIDRAFFFTDREEKRHILGHTEISAATEQPFNSHLVMAVRGFGRVERVLPPLQALVRDVITPHIARFAVPHDGPAPQGPFHLVRVDDVWYTQHMRDGLQTGSPEFRVTSIDACGEECVAECRRPVPDGVLRPYDPSGFVTAAMPKDANAAHTPTDGVSYEDKGDHWLQKNRVRYYRVAVDASMRCPPTQALADDLEGTLQKLNDLRLL